MASPKKKLVAVVAPPPDIGTMTQAELKAYATRFFHEHIEPLQQKVNETSAPTNNN